jgi:hypothetical protein
VTSVSRCSSDMKRSSSIADLTRRLHKVGPGRVRDCSQPVPRTCYRRSSTTEEEFKQAPSPVAKARILRDHINDRQSSYPNHWQEADHVVHHGIGPFELEGRCDARVATLGLGTAAWAPRLKAKSELGFSPAQRRLTVQREFAPRPANSLPPRARLRTTYRAC